MGALGEAREWRCFDKSHESEPLPMPFPLLIPPSYAMAFFLADAANVRTLALAMRHSRRSYIVAYREGGELLVLSEMVFDTLESPAVKMLDLRSDGAGRYSGATNSSLLQSDGRVRVLGQSDRRPLTDSELAKMVEVGRTLWKWRCAGPRT